MCGRFVTPRLDGIQPLFDVAVTGDDLPGQNFDTRPTDPVPVVIESSKGEPQAVRRLEAARWALIPSWAKEPPRFPTFNARSEEAASKPTWKASVQSKRCIIPADGFYEWLTEGKVKTPFYITDPDAEILAFAGLYSWWGPSPSAPWLLTATVLTRVSVGSMVRLHERSPVTLPEAAWSEWLDPEVKGDQGLVDVMVSMSTPVVERLAFYQVKPLRGNGPELILPSATQMLGAPSSKELLSGLGES